jgi:hypothetical protein
MKSQTSSLGVTDRNHSDPALQPITFYPRIGKSYDDLDVDVYYTHLFCKVNEKDDFYKNE